MSEAERLAALERAGLVHPRAEAVTAPLFSSGGFFLAADKVQPAVRRQPLRTIMSHKSVTLSHQHLGQGHWPHRPRRACPGAIRAQDDQVNSLGNVIAPWLGGKGTLMVRLSLH